MKILRTIFPIAMLFLSACTPITLHMDIDSQLQKESNIYSVKFDTDWTRYAKDFSFGSYHVKKSTNLMTTVLNKETINPTLLNYFIFGEQEILSSKVAKSHSYEFEQDSKSPWKANCTMVSEQEETKHSGINLIENYSSQYVCTYTREKNDPWYLSIKGNDTENSAIILSNQKINYSAILTPGIWSKANGNKVNVGFVQNAGYTWVRDDIKIAAVSSEVQHPKIWLSKNNSEEVNSIISMASAGIILYEFIVKPTE